MVEPDRTQIEAFVMGMFRHADLRGFASMPGFQDNSANKVFRITGAPLSGGLDFVVDVAEDDARRAANSPEPIVFCPPVATFASKDRARERDISEGLALSVECDRAPTAARDKLEQILGSRLN